MPLSYDDVFKYSEILNPISSITLFLAGKLAQLNPNKKVLDVGSGKGFPSLLWASIFGVQIEGYDLGEQFVEYANSHANLLNLSHQVMYYSKDVKELYVERKFDVVASLGLGIVPIYGTIRDGLKHLKKMLISDGFLIFAEPIWIMKPVPSEILDYLGTVEDHFLTKSEFHNLIKDLEFQVKGCFISTKIDWEIYIIPVIRAMNEIIESDNELAEEAKKMRDIFTAEYDFVGQYWNMVLWVLQG
jgi:2-polyprenyl-3-methyl-5-hydroxy-6-metoxy-1,4-benzoquinol methylase